MKYYIEYTSVAILPSVGTRSVGLNVHHDEDCFCFLNSSLGPVYNECRVQDDKVKILGRELLMQQF